MNIRIGLVPMIIKLMINFLYESHSFQSSANAFLHKRSSLIHKDIEFQGCFSVVNTAVACCKYNSIGCIGFPK